VKIAIVGTGYAGLVTGTCLAEVGNKVTCIDIDTEKIASLQQGKVTMYEPNFDVMLQQNLEQHRLSFTSSLLEGVTGAAVIYLVLPTPEGKDGSADLTYIYNVADELGPLLSEYTVVVDKSTVPPGTTDEIQRRLARNAGIEFDVISNPEFCVKGRRSKIL
jgi:UDPglucose 6-dehydrogenase